MSPCKFLGVSRSSCLTLGGDEGNRTLDPLLAGQVLSQLSYTPDCEVSQAISCLFVTLRSLKIEQQQTHTQKLVYSLAVRKKLFLVLVYFQTTSCQ